MAKLSSNNQVRRAPDLGAGTASRIEISKQDILTLILEAPYMLPLKGIMWVVNWVIEPLKYIPRLATEEEILKLLEEAPQSNISPFYLDMIERGNIPELQRHIVKLHKKIIADQKVINCNGYGRYAKQHRLRTEVLKGVLVEHIDTLDLLEQRCSELEAAEAAKTLTVLDLAKGFKITP